MLSTCPNCLNQANHPDKQTEVKCSDCGTVYQTLLKVNVDEEIDESSHNESSNPGETPSFDPIPMGEPMGEPALGGDNGGGLEMIGDLGPISSPEVTNTQTGPGPSSMEAPDFSESTNAFAEIRDFGEAVADGKPPPPTPPPARQPLPNEAQPVPNPVLKNSGGGASWLMTSGDLLQNHAIQEYLSPVSVLCELAPGDNPMQPAFNALRTQAQKLGGNAVVAMRWSLSGDASKVLVSGTAVKCAKTSS